MVNTIVVRIEFSFKGESHNLKASLDLDTLMQGGGQLPNLYNLVAIQNKVDTYSYLYEVMESSDIIFDNATGVASQCVAGGQFDMTKFELLWRGKQAQAALQAIAKKHLNVDDFETQPMLRDALFEAYQLGKSDR